MCGARNGEKEAVPSECFGILYGNHSDSATPGHISDEAPQIAKHDQGAASWAILNIDMGMKGIQILAWQDGESPGGS